jgi:hypothetical protein
MILTKMKHIAEVYLGFDAWPLYLHAQRQATKDVGVMKHDMDISVDKRSLQKLRKEVEREACSQLATTGLCRD